MPIFFTKKSCNKGGWNHPPQMPLTVNGDDTYDSVVPPRKREYGISYNALSLPFDSCFDSWRVKVGQNVNFDI